MNEQTTPVINKEELRETIAEVLDVEVTEVTDTADFVKDLGVDSLMALELTVRLERSYGVRVQERELAEVTTLEKTYQLLIGKLAAA